MAQQLRAVISQAQEEDQRIGLQAEPERRYLKQEPETHYLKQESEKHYLRTALAAGGELSAGLLQQMPEEEPATPSRKRKKKHEQDQSYHMHR
ncbi:hypothetical protein [Mucilaginibacter sp. OK268]|uniref:hypothetical protein n=1 Tax=Mucilaginibacter sp. OK268 TaxID=1881048 RepID=UPI002100FE98|nr:hypothetical protein [Mucilaginibacter sp. OK268]